MCHVCCHAVVMLPVCETFLCACGCSGRGCTGPCLSFPTHRLPSPHGLEACGSFAGGALVLRASCHFLYSTAVIGARKRAVNRPADKEREPLFLEVSSRTSSSPIVGRRSTTQQPRETNVCHVCCHAAVMLPVCETFLSALADAAAEDAQAPVCLFCFRG